MRNFLILALMALPFLAACEPRTKPWSSAEGTVVLSLIPEVEQWMRKV